MFKRQRLSGYARDHSDLGCWPNLEVKCTFTAIMRWGNAFQSWFVDVAV